MRERRGMDGGLESELLILDIDDSILSHDMYLNGIFEFGRHFDGLLIERMRDRCD